MSANLFALCLIVLNAYLAIATLAPRRQDNYVQLEPIGDNKYTLRIGVIGAVRQESVELIEPGDLIVKGQLIEKFRSPSGTLTVTYEAGPNGYVAKYSFVFSKDRELPPTVPPSTTLRQSSLKSATG